MALVRVYCGLAAANVPSWLSVAVVDDAGRLLDLCELSDDPAGYARLGALLAQRSGGSAPVAADRGDHLLAQLLAAANRPIAIADPDSVADFAERFCDDESPDERESPAPQRRAVGLARALQAGALSAVAQSPAWDLDEFKPVLAAHAAVTAGRQAAAAALREVLRELYPAALRAYPDPAEHVPLKILDALPEPGLLTSSPSARSRDAALIAELSATGVADTTSAVSAITALRVAVQESPRRNTHRMLGPVVAETVRQAVAAVRACDAASAALVATLVERLGPASTAVPQRPHLVSVAPESPAPRRPAGPAAEVPLSRMAPRERTPSAAAAGVGAGVSPAPPVPLAPAGPQMPQMPMMPEAPAAMTPDYLSGLPAPRPAAGRTGRLSLGSTTASPPPATWGARSGACDRTQPATPGACDRTLPATSGALGSMTTHRPRGLPGSTHLPLHSSGGSPSRQCRRVGYLRRGWPTTCRWSRRRCGSSRHPVRPVRRWATR